MTLLPIPAEFLIYKENFHFFFISVTRAELPVLPSWCNYIFSQFDLMLGLLQGGLGLDYRPAIEGAALKRPYNGILQLAVRLLYSIWGTSLNCYAKVYFLQR
jgi:hypothetical protein